MHQPRKTPGEQNRNRGTWKVAKGTQQGNPYGSCMGTEVTGPGGPPILSKVVAVSAVLEVKWAWAAG
jgi:hypothetical protein